MPTISVAKDLGSGVWAVDDAPGATPDALIVEPSDGVYSADDVAVEGYAIYIDDDGETVYIVDDEPVGPDPNPSGDPETTPVTMEVAPSLISLIPTQATTFVAKTYNGSHNVITETYTWLSDDPLVATVHPTSGLVTAIAEGVANITATGDDSTLNAIGVVRVVDAPTWSGSPGAKGRGKSPFTFARRKK